MFETGTRRRGRSLVGANKANPIGFLLASADCLDRLPGLATHAAIIRKAVLEVLANPVLRTVDMPGGTATTSQIVEAICDRVAELTLAAAGHSDYK